MTLNAFERGERVNEMRTVICNDPIEGFLTKGRQYTVIGERPEENRLVMIDDRGLEGWFNKQRFSDLHTPKGSPDFSETSYIRDEVKNTCEKITCPVIESVNDQIMKTPLRTAHERIVELEAALNKIANHRKPPMHHSMYEGIARAVLKRGAQ